MDISSHCQPKGLIEAEIPQDRQGRAEELERIARFFAVLPQKMRPNP
jgi:hypothetical protein